jgi:hypothetical protein
VHLFEDVSRALPLLGGVVQSQRLVVPIEVLRSISTYREACRVAWDLRRVRNLTRASLAEQAELYVPHVSDYFSALPTRRELPARHIAAVESVLGNTAISQWLALQSGLEATALQQEVA